LQFGASMLRLMGQPGKAITRLECAAGKPGDWRRRCGCGAGSQRRGRGTPGPRGRQQRLWGSVSAAQPGLRAEGSGGGHRRDLGLRRQRCPRWVPGSGWAMAGPSREGALGAHGHPGHAPRCLPEGAGGCWSPEPPLAWVNRGVSQLKSLRFLT